MRTHQISTADFGVTELSSDELQANGGTWLAVAIVVGGYIVANWADIKDGFAAGYNS